jgi:hypothetical protein
MHNPAARYEFRLFGQCFESGKQRRRAMADIDTITESSETSFLGRASDPGHNVQLRGGSLELKRLIEQQAGLERWLPAGQWTLPVAADTALEPLLPGGGGAWKFALSAQPDLAELLAFAAHPAVPGRGLQAPDSLCPVTVPYRAGPHVPVVTDGDDAIQRDAASASPRPASPRFLQHASSRRTPLSQTSEQASPGIHGHTSPRSGLLQDWLNAAALSLQILNASMTGRA